ncbi:O-antigen ligase family protein [Hymenobacter cellulosilyticus]|uniref:O-antigen ligase family protein n=1 Tax=Hymenobacter cellulosilyticus TaxID=2932248 RepID=A0A8T9Q4J8_9BACT|nr:O-antigen ligase family protein [Hymenobacter cellulosilyticus]UOQ70033.1 O-antigen ligase family protein [Hymenobacter cellulosilyticus]
MKLSLRFRYLLVLLVVLFTDAALSSFVWEAEDDPMLRVYNYALLGLASWLIVRSWRWFSSGMWRWLLLVLVSLAALALESYAGWGTWVVYPHVFSKLTPYLVLFGVYAYYRRHGVPPLGFVMVALPVLVSLNILVFHPEAFTIAGFLSHNRGVNTTSAFLLVLPAVYFLNRYLVGKSLFFLLYFFVDVGIIIFLQHRTVWLSTGLALFLNLILVARASTTRLGLLRFLPVVLIPLFFGLLGGLTVVLNNPDVLKKLNSNIEDISNSDSQGTGSWRLQQFQAYEQFLWEYPVAGMRLKGFELPMQFFHQESGEPVWPDYTGHHFHSFYVDRMFYFGLIGVLLAILPVLLLVVRSLSPPRPLPLETIALVAYAGSGLLYGVSYDWPLYFFGLLGLAFAAAELAVLEPAPSAPVPETAQLPDLLSHPEAAILPQFSPAPSPTAPAHASL